MKCGFCGKEFELDQCGPGCASCPLQSGCGGVRCPYCGYNNVQEAALIRWIRNLFTRPSDEPTATQEGR